MEDMLTEHPELAPEVVKSLSKLLTTSRQKVAELERKVQEQESSLASSNENYARITESELADLRAEQADAKVVRESLETRFCEVRTRETDVGTREANVETERQGIASKMEAFSAAVEEITVQAAAKASTLQAQLRAAVTEQMDSQRALDTARHEISARDEAYSTLSNAHQNLAEKFRVSQLKVTEHWQELARRRDVESELAAARAHLGAKTTDFAAHVSLAEDTLRALREKLDTANSQMTALHGTHAQLDREVSALRTRQATLDETLAQKQGHLDAREAELHALRKDIIVRDAELAAAAERAEQGREWERSQLAALQAELEALRSTDEDNRVLREVDAAREVELSALREDIGALREVGTLQEEASTRETLAATREQESVTLRVLRQENGLLLQNLRTATTAAGASAEKLKETLKGRQKEIVQLKKKISQGEQSAAKTKAELLQLKEKVNALDRRCSEQDVTHTKLVQENQEARRQHHAERDELEEQIKATSDWAAAEYQVWLDENRRHQVKVMSLEETIKNLQASVLRAGAQAKQELRKTADDERHRLEDKVHARDEENDDLRYDLKGALRELKSLKKAFQEIESHRAELITEVNVSRTRVRSRTPDVYASSSREYIEPPSFEPHRYTPEIYFESEDNGIEMQEGGQWGYSVPDTPDPDPEAVKQERLSYRQFMRAFPYPQVRPPFKFDLLEPVQEIGTNPLHNFTHDYPSPRRTLHCPKRSIWCGSERVHVLVFAPTHEYWYETDTWAVSTKMAGYLGKEFDFFINQGSHVYYVGTYKVHSLRTVHPPGSRITSDVSQAAILRATGLSAHLKEKITECFADGEIKTECFGLQCVGFDQQLYDSLRQRFKAGAGAGKRKAGSEDFRDKGKAKSQKLY